MFRRISIGVTCLCLVACEPTSDKPGVVADTIFVGDHIITMDGSTIEAVAISGERISATGAAVELLKMRGPHTRVIELGDHALVPGFIDAHGHFAFVARLMNFANLSSPPVGPVENIDDVVRLLREHISKRNIAPGEWVLGYGYDDSLLEENRHPDRDDLDRASEDHPIALMHVSGHLGAVNSAALAAHNITSETDDPAGGVIRRRAGSRQPNGVLEETAASSVLFAEMGNTDRDTFSASLRKALDLHASYGVTTVQDGATTLKDVAVLREEALREPFALDVVAFPYVNQLDDDTALSLRHEPAYAGGFRVGGVKFGLDGSPQGRTAFLSKPYTEGPPGAHDDYRAYAIYDADEFTARLADFVERGVPVLTHANGDAAIDMVIDSMTEVFEGRTVPDHRSVIIHAQLMRDDQLDDVKTLGLIPSYYSVHPFFWGDWHRKSFGEERAAFISPVRATLERDILLTIHNDAPVVPPDMMRLIWIAVNRKTRSGYVLGPDQRATVMEALRAVTLDAAYQYFEEDNKGSISPGKQADLVVLGENPLTVEPDRLKDIPVLETIARGKTVYSSD